MYLDNLFSEGTLRGFYLLALTVNREILFFTNINDMHIYVCVYLEIDKFF